MTSVCISDVVSASVYSEKTRMKKLMMMKMMMITIIIIIIIVIIIMNKSRIDDFSRAPEIDFR